MLGHMTQARVGGAGRELPEPLQSLASHWSAALRQGTARTHTYTHLTYGESFAYQQCMCVRECVMFLFARKQWEAEVVNIFSFSPWHFLPFPREEM